MDKRSTTVEELETLLNKFKVSSYSDVWALEEMHAKLVDLKNSFTSSSFGSEFTPTKATSLPKKKFPTKKVASSSDDSESSSLSDSESDSEEEPVRKKRASPAVFTGKKKSAKFGGGGGSSASDSDSEENSEEEKPRRGTPKKLLKKKKDPNAPKRPMSAYLIFSTEKRTEVRMAHPDWKIIDISKHLAIKWKEMPDSEKQIYQDKALQEKQRYEAEMRNYNNPEQSDKKTVKKAVPKKALQFFRKKDEEEEDDEDKDEDEDDEEEKRPPKAKLAKDGPKRPLSAFMLFVREKRDEVKANKPELTFGQLTMELANLWKGLNEEDRKIWTDQAQADKERYQNELRK